MKDVEKLQKIFIMGVSVGQFCAAANMLNARGAEWSWSVGPEHFNVYAEWNVEEGPQLMFTARWEFYHTMAGAQLEENLYALLTKREDEYE